MFMSLSVESRREVMIRIHYEDKALAAACMFEWELSSFDINPVAVEEPDVYAYDRELIDGGLPATIGVVREILEERREQSERTYI